MMNCRKFLALLVALLATALSAGPVHAAATQVESFFGTFVFAHADQKIARAGFVEFHTDHTWTRVMHVDTNGDGQTDDTIVVEVDRIQTGVEDDATQLAVNDLTIDSIYPNPAAAAVHIRYTLPGGHQSAAGSDHLFVYDLLGRERRSVSLTHDGASEREIEINVSDLPAGVYLIQLQASGQSKVRSFVKVE